MPAIVFPRPIEGTGVPPPATTGFPDLIVEIGRYSGWILGDSVLSILGTSTIPGLTTLEWEDITSKVRNLSIRRGRQHELDRVEAGTASLTLMNQDGAFNATNTASPYWPIIRPMTPVRVRASFVEEAPQFSPLDIAGLLFWHDFSDVTTLWQDSARTTPITAGGQTIKGVSDKSGAGRHLGTAIGGTYQTGILNGLSVVRTTSTAANFVCTIPSTQYGTLFAVIKRTGTTATHSFSGPDQSLRFNSNLMFLWNNGGVNGTDWGNTTFNIATAKFISGSETLYKNGVSDGTGATGVPGGTTSYAAPSSWEGDTAESIFYTPALSNADMNLVGDYLAVKYGLTWTAI